MELVNLTETTVVVNTGAGTNIIMAPTIGYTVNTGTQGSIDATGIVNLTESMVVVNTGAATDVIVAAPVGYTVTTGVVGPSLTTRTNKR